MNPEQAAKMLELLQRIAVALEQLLPALQKPGPQETAMHITAQPLSFNLPRTTEVVRSGGGGVR